MSLPGSPARAPLEGRPERTLEALRKLIGLARWPLAILLPVWALPALAPLVRAHLPSSTLRSLLAPVLFVGIAWLVLRALRGLTRLLHLARTVHPGEGSLHVSRRRLPARVTFPLVSAPEEEGEEVPYREVQQLFRVSLEEYGEPMVSVGVWYRGGDGRAREMWLHLEPEDADRVLARLVEATALEPRSPEEKPEGEE